MKRTTISACISRDAVASPPRIGTIGLGVSFEARKGQKSGARALGIANVNDTLYFIGGFTGDPSGLPWYYMFLDTNEQYTPIGYGTLPEPTPTPSPHTEPFPALAVAAVSVTTIIVVSIGLLFYFKKRKR